MNEAPKSIGKRELFLLIAIIGIAVVLYGFNQLRTASPAAYVEVSIINEASEKVVLKTWNLEQNIEYDIVTTPMLSGEPDGLNRLVIQDGAAWISEANCPNHDCVKKGKIHEHGEMLVCIPHRLTVTIIGEN